MAGGRIRRNDRTMFRTMEENPGGVLLNIDSGEYRQLNSTGALIWSLLEKEPTRAELLDKLGSRITDSPPEMGHELDRFLDALEERNLISVEDE